MGKFRVPSGVMGDLNVSWDKDDPDDIRQAEEFFKQQKEKGCKFIAVINGKMKKITEFDSTADHLLVIPKVKAGC